MISNLDIIRAWKDEQFRHSLSAQEQGHLPVNPAGTIALNDSAMAQEEDPLTVTLLIDNTLCTQSFCNFFCKLERV